MSEERKIEQEIGWYKVSFAILAATAISLLAWLAQNYDSAKTVLLIFCLISIAIVVIVVALINKKVFKNLDKLKEL